MVVSLANKAVMYKVYFNLNVEVSKVNQRQKVCHILTSKQDQGCIAIQGVKLYTAVAFINLNTLLWLRILIDRHLDNILSQYSVYVGGSTTPSSQIGTVNACANVYITHLCAELHWSCD